MFEETQQQFNSSVRKIAESNVIKKLNKEGISRAQVGEYKFNELVDLEIEIIKKDGKKVGAGIGVGVAITLLTGGMF